MKLPRYTMQIAPASFIVAVAIVFLSVRFYHKNQIRRHNRCIAILCQLDSAKENFAMSMGLKDGAEVTMTDVARSHIPNQQAQLLISQSYCLAGGTIVLGKIGEDPYCTVHGKAGQFIP